MPQPTTVTLDEAMQEIVTQAIHDGDGTTAEDIVRIALNDWWDRQMLSGYSPEELRRIGDEIVADTRPGIPAEQFFVELKEYCRQLDAQHRAVDAA